MAKKQFRKEAIVTIPALDTGVSKIYRDDPKVVSILHIKTKVN